MTAVGCSERDFESGGSDVRRQEVSIGVPSVSVSRTVVGDDGTSAWCEGDKIALWAADDEGVFALGGDIFSMWHYDASYSSAFFTGTTAPMAEGRYTYYAASPAPLSTEGTIATYEIPVGQNGGNTLRSDIMVARPATALQLNEGRNLLDLHFEHILHAVKITIPEDGNLMNRPITAFKMVFPTDVTGTVKVDASDPDAVPELVEGGNTLDISFDEPKQAGDAFWALIYPAEIAGEVRYTAYAEGYESKENSFTMNKQCLAGRVTPMSLTIPKLNLTTKIVFSVGDNFLGQDVESFVIRDDAQNTLFSFVRNDENIYEYVVEGEIEVPEYSGKSLTAVFESADAIVSERFDMPEIVPYIRNTVAPIKVPYLFYEDFSGITVSDGDTFSESETNKSSTPNGVDLTKYGLAQGWTGARVGGAAGYCLRVNTKFETGLMAKKTYKGQIDTPALEGLKEGHSVTVKVEFDADAAGDYTTCYVGNITAAGAVNGETAILNGSTITMSATGGISFSSQFTPREATVPDCNRTSRIAFQPNNTRSGELSVKYYDHFIYIDNIRISIVNE